MLMKQYQQMASARDRHLQMVSARDKVPADGQCPRQAPAELSRCYFTQKLIHILSVNYLRCSMNRGCVEGSRNSSNERKSQGVSS